MEKMKRLKGFDYFLYDLGYLFYKLLSNLGRDTLLYRCGNCNAILKPKQKVCSRCDYGIIWSGK